MRFRLRAELRNRQRALSVMSLLGRSQIREQLLKFYCAAQRDGECRHKRLPLWQVELDLRRANALCPSAWAWRNFRSHDDLRVTKPARPGLALSCSP